MSGEFDTIDRFRASMAGPPPGETWIGDDAAVVATPGAPWVLLAADAVVGGVHADLTLTSLADLGWKAMTSNLSDLAAMGAAPWRALVTIAAPAGTDLDVLYEGLAAAAAAYDCPIVGGDLSAADALVVAVAVTGTSAVAPVRRDGARAGDGIWVTGALGASAAGLRLLRRGDDAGLPPATAGRLRLAHARPVPRLAEGRAALAGGATAMIDVSDGIGADLGHIADASGVGFELDAVPAAEGATEDEALGGGEDYQLVFTAPAGADGRILAAFAGLDPPERIGTCVTDGHRRTLAGRPMPASGWQHAW